jgi:hypothetical protein
MPTCPVKVANWPYQHLTRVANNTVCEGVRRKLMEKIHVCIQMHEFGRKL